MLDVATKSGACPTFFRGLCRTAVLPRSGGYRWAGHGLIGHIAELSPYSVEEVEWDRRVEALHGLIEAKDDKGVLGWLDRELPRCMALVPRARRGSFLAGIYQVVNDEGLNLAHL